MAFCSELSTLALRTSSAVRPNLVRIPVAFPAPYQSAGVGFSAGAGIDGQRFAREHGLIDQDRSIEQAHIRSDDEAERQLDQVAYNERGCGNCGPHSVTLHSRDQRQSRFEASSVACALPFWKKPIAPFATRRKATGGFHIIAEK
jgi:hypothetical protein